MKEAIAAYQLDGPTLSLGSYQSGDELRDDSLITSILEKSNYRFERLDDLKKMRSFLHQLIPGLRE